MKFSKAFLQEMTYEDEMELVSGYFNGFVIEDMVVKNVQKEVVDTSRWSIIYEQVFSVTKNDETKYYKTSWSEGATENQDESPYEYEEDMIEVSEVFPVEKTIIVYE